MSEQEKAFDKVINETFKTIMNGYAELTRIFAWIIVVLNLVIVYIWYVLEVSTVERAIEAIKAFLFVHSVIFLLTLAPYLRKK